MLSLEMDMPLTPTLIRACVCRASNFASHLRGHLTCRGVAQAPDSTTALHPLQTIWNSAKPDRMNHPASSRNTSLHRLSTPRREWDQVIYVNTADSLAIAECPGRESGRQEAAYYL